ncbi:PASTA domain-containing protein, partial [Streptomyces xanthophaeus]
PRRELRPRRGTLLVVVGVLLALGLGTGVWYINSGQFTKVPHLLGKTEKQARGQLNAEGLAVKGISQKFSNSFERGAVMDTDPPAGKRIRTNGAVALTISRGPEVVAVPNLKGRPLEEARTQLTEAGLAPGLVTQAFSQDIAQGAVISSDPAGGEKRAPDTAVALVVSKGRPVPVPNVAGQQVDQARAALEGLGLKVAVAPEEVNSPGAAGTVANQSVGAGTQAAAGDTVTLTVSKGPRQLPVPNVTGQDVDAARKTLEGAGFKVKVERPFLSFSNTVESQSVPAGQNAPEGSTITVKTKGL